MQVVAYSIAIQLYFLGDDEQFSPDCVLVIFILATDFEG